MSITMSTSTSSRDGSPVSIALDNDEPNVLIERESIVYQNVPDNPTLPGLYPMTGSSIYPSMTSPSDCQAHLLLESNFSTNTHCNLFEVKDGGSGVWTTFDTDADIGSYLRNRRGQTTAPVLRVLFVYLEECIDASFGCRVSISQGLVQEILNNFNVSPHFVQFLLGRPDYLAPFQSQCIDAEGELSLEFICQFPQWLIRGSKKELPCSLFLNYEADIQATTYVIAYERDQTFINRARKTLSDTFCMLSTSTNCKGLIRDPFFFGSVLANESLLECETAIRGIRNKLNHQLNVVDALNVTHSDHATLSTITKDLHYLAQDCEVVSANTDTLTMVARALHQAYNRLTSASTHLRSTNLQACLNHHCDAVEAQKRWILSYIARKEAARMHVNQLVTQQNSRTNTQIALVTQENSRTNTKISLATSRNSLVNTNIAHATLRDSAVMKVIAIVTMVFLPSSVVTSFFGMVFFNSNDDSDRSDSAYRKLWIFWVVAIPLTCIVMVISYTWWKWFDPRKELAKEIGSPSSSASNDVDHLEQGCTMPRLLLDDMSILTHQISRTERGSGTLVSEGISARKIL